MEEKIEAQPFDVNELIRIGMITNPKRGIRLTLDVDENYNVVGSSFVCLLLAQKQDQQMFNPSPQQEEERLTHQAKPSP